MSGSAAAERLHGTGERPGSPSVPFFSPSSEPFPFLPTDLLCVLVVFSFPGVETPRQGSPADDAGTHQSPATSDRSVVHVSSFREIVLAVGAGARKSQPFSRPIARYHPMTAYTATVTVRLKRGVLNPEAETTRKALERLEFELEDLRMSDRFEIDLEAESADSARERVTEMAERLLANPTIHDFEVAIEER
jgi:phosphoribosylformylglycinamidine synthase PurS subunit